MKGSLLKIAVVHNSPGEEGSANWESSRDVLEQVEAVADSLDELEIPCLKLEFDRDLARFAGRLVEEGVGGIVNLCESVDEDSRLIGHPAAVFDLLGIPYSGSGPLALMLTTDKLLAKQQLVAAGFPTPAFTVYEGGGPGELLDFPLPALIKPRLEDASIGIDQESVITTKKEMRERLPEFFHRHGPLLVEEFVGGREFNISLFGYPVPRVLPAAEIDFSDFPDELHRIVGYRAKWQRDSFEYQHTDRFFPQNLPVFLERKLRKIAAGVYRLFMLRDYGRIDLRMDERGRIFVLEANANPCLSPDAGFPAAACQGGSSYREMVRELVGFLTMRSRK